MWSALTSEAGDVVWSERKQGLDIVARRGHADDVSGDTGHAGGLQELTG